MSEWGPLYAGLGVIGGALVVFLIFLAVTVYKTRRQQKQQKQTGSNGRRHVRVSSRMGVTVDVYAVCVPEEPSEPAAPCGTPGPTAEPSANPGAGQDVAPKSPSPKRPPPSPEDPRFAPLSKIDLTTVGVPGVTMEETLTDNGVCTVTVPFSCVDYVQMKEMDKDSDFPTKTVEMDKYARSRIAKIDMTTGIKSETTPAKSDGDPFAAYLRHSLNVLEVESCM